MNIVFLRSGYGKPDSRFEKEVAASIEAGNKVLIIAWNREGKKDKKHKMLFLNKEVFVIHIGVPSELASGFLRNLIPMIRFNFKLYKYLKKYKKQYDIIHSCDFDTVLPAFLIKLKFNKKLIYDIYDYYADSHHMPKLIENSVRWVDNRVINNSDAVLICNEKRKEQIKPACPHKLVIIHNSPERVMNNYTINGIPEKKRFRIVFIGGFVKTGRYIFEMIDVIRKRKDCELVIGGFGAGEEEIDQISKLEDNIIFIGKQDYQSVLAIEQTADLLTALYDPTLKNHRYAAPNKFYEALMLGKPIICAKNTNIDRYIRKNNLGWVLDVPNKPFEDELNDALNKAIAMSEEKREQVSKKAIRLFNENFDWVLMKKKLADLYIGI